MSVPAASAAAAASAGGVGTPAAAAAGEVGEAESLAYVLRPAPAELEYLAEQQLVTVTPNFTAGVLKLIEVRRAGNWLLAKGRGAEGADF